MISTPSDPREPAPKLVYCIPRSSISPTAWWLRLNRTSQASHIWDWFASNFARVWNTNFYFLFLRSMLGFDDSEPITDGRNWKTKICRSFVELKSFYPERVSCREIMCYLELLSTNWPLPGARISQHINRDLSWKDCHCYWEKAPTTYSQTKVNMYI